jgi:hypothetical protein
MSQAVLEQPQTATRLVRPREDAIKFLSVQIDKGAELKALRIRSGPELDKARALKLDWITSYTELLKDLFSDDSVAEACNDWVGKIYPEYASFGNFVEQFYAEVEHRQKRLKVVHRRIEKNQSEITPSPAAAGAAAAATAPVIRQVPAPLAPELHAVLLVFGADEATKNAVCEFLDALGVELSLVDQASAGDGGIVEALDRVTDASFALILPGNDQNDRSFELGFCVGRLGLKRVCMLHPNAASVGPDPRGLTHVALDAGGGWQLNLARHLKRAGLGVDLNRLC